MIGRLDREASAGSLRELQGPMCPEQGLEAEAESRWTYRLGATSQASAGGGTEQVL